MKLPDLNNKKIALLGLGAENYSLLKFLFKKKVQAEFTIHDMRDKAALGEKYEELRNKVNWVFGPTANQGLYKFDILFRSPGWPTSCPGIKEALKKKKTILYSPIRLFFDLVPTKNIIGVTGTKGKGTTSSLIYEILKKAGKKVWLGGNIGIAPFDFVRKLKTGDWVVLELSSFQLEDLHQGPKIAVITNFYSEHLAAADPNNPNFHPTLKKYWEAKANVFRWQGSDDFAVINRKIRSKVKGQRSEVIYFEKSELPSRLPGEHNKENIAAAVEVAKLLKIKAEVIERAVAGFKGLEHRLEKVGEVKGVTYYNDSFATTPESTIIGLKSFAAPIVLLAGGADKGSDFKALAKEIKKRVKFVVLFAGQATPRIEKELLKIKYPRNLIKTAKSMAEAVRLAARQAAGGEVVLASPACASFGMFKNYKERGSLFKGEVLKLK